MNVARKNTNNVLRLIIDFAYPGLSQFLMELQIDGSIMKQTINKRTKIMTKSFNFGF